MKQTNVQTRRQLLKTAVESTAALACAHPALALLRGSDEVFSQIPGPVRRTALEPTALQPLPLGTIKPSGWMLRQLRIQADGLSGHLDETWPDVGPNSGWLGGTGESWERGPYYLDGLVPLAYLLDDKSLKAKAQKFIDWTLDHQREDGAIGPVSNDDWWPRMVMMKALAQYFEATQDPRVPAALTRYFHYQLEQLPKRPLASWGKYRWQDEVLVVEWLFERTKDPKLLELAGVLRDQGFDWVASFEDFEFKTPATRAVLKNTGGNNSKGMQSHGVNNGQALKTAAVQFRLTGDPKERGNLYRQLDALYRYHGVPNGMFSCDEHLAGLNPSQGTELCTVVETLFSLEVALATFGDAELGDRIEKIAFNALPGTLTEDMWAHQYDQQSNQVQVSLNSKPWTTNGPEANIFGLQPNFGCCTANYHQGWPKMISALWMKTSDDGLAATLYSPCTVNTTVRGIAVRLVEETDYPFRSKIRVTVQTNRTVNFPLLLRIPAWATEATILVNGKQGEASVQAGSFARIERAWRAGDQIEITLPMFPRVSRWYNRAVTVERGPLVFSLSPGEDWVQLQKQGLTADWQVYPTAGWNYALAVTEENAGALIVVENEVGARPFGLANPAVVIRAKARRLSSWRSEDGVAAAPPMSPVRSELPEEDIRLVPYAAAKLRITAFPELAV